MHVQEAGVNPKLKSRIDPLMDLPEDLWLRIFSYMDIRSLLDSCALVCHTWLGIVYQMTGKHLSFTGERLCRDCYKEVSQLQEQFASVEHQILHLVDGQEFWNSSPLADT